jgi:hypothetical protein
MSYLLSEAWIKVSENLSESTDKLGETIAAETQHTRDLIRELNSLGKATVPGQNLGKQQEQPPPSVE